jgi:hydroxymethylpyrimidine pyrophosphatase-like HAD family hydrolase
MISKGWIALDIDGTITLDKYSVPKEVTAYLRSLNMSGWNIAMVTGRPYSFAAMALSDFDFPYTFLAQNGSVGLEMPQKKLLFKVYIQSKLIPLVEKAFEGIDSDFLIYAGYEKGDFCYWRPNRFSPEDLRYLSDLQKRQKEKWQQVDRYENVKLDAFPMIKCFGNGPRMDLIASRLRAMGQFEIAKIRDPFEEGYYILLVNDINASKGRSLTRVFDLKGRGAQVIAAGDDENDLSLLEVADTKIAMSHAPKSLQKVATFIAPPTQDCGIIQALQMAISK